MVISRPPTSIFATCWSSSSHPGRRLDRTAAAGRRRESAQGRTGRIGRGFVLHSADFFIENSTLPIDDGICLTATLDILKAIARGKGPESAVLALGYAGWAPGQLETEIQENGWLHCSADAELIFGPDTNGKYEQALKKLGVHLGMLSSEAGHA